MNQIHSCKPVLLESLLHWVFGKVQENKVPFFTSLIVGMLAHGYAFTNKLVNHDEVFYLYGKGATYISGRWGLEILEKFMPNISMPWIYGVMLLIFMAVSVCLIVNIFEIKNKLLQGLLAGCILAFPSLTATITYFFTAASYSVAFFLVVLAIWCIQRDGYVYKLLGLGVMIFSLSIYQAYISLAASLLVLLVMQMLIQGQSLKKAWKQGIFYVCFLIVSLGVYYMATEAINWIKNVEFGHYASENMSFSIRNLPARTVDAYQCFVNFLKTKEHGLIPSRLSEVLHLLSFASVGVLSLVLIFKQTDHKAVRGLFFLCMVLILPLAINCMFLFATDDAIHTLVLYGFVSVYVFLTLVADMCIDRADLDKVSAFLGSASIYLLSLGLAVVIAINTYVANTVYLHLYLRYEIANGFYNSVITELRMNPAFDENTKLYIAGHYEESDFYYENYQSILNIKGARGFRPSSYSYPEFLEYYLDFPISSASAEEIGAIRATEEFAGMPYYPYYGSVKMFDDVLVVKLPD